MSEKPAENSPSPLSEPIRATSFLDDDLDVIHESPKDRIFEILKWVVLVGGLCAVLYFAGDFMRHHWTEELQQQIQDRDQKISQLQNEAQSLQGAVVRFTGLVQQVNPSPKGKAYLIMDEKGQPWFAISTEEFKKSDRVLVEVAVSSLNQPVTITLKKKRSESAAPKAAPKSSSTSSHSH